MLMVSRTAFAVVIALLWVEPATAAEPHPGLQVAQAEKEKLHRFLTGQSYLLLSRDRRQLYVKGMVDMVYYVYLEKGKDEDGKASLRKCLDAKRAAGLELRFRNYLRSASDQWSKPAASLFMATILRTCGVKALQN